MKTIQGLSAQARRVVAAGALGITFLMVPAFAGVASASGTSGSGISGSSGYDYSTVSGQPTVGAPSEQQLTDTSGRHRNDYIEQQLYPSAPAPRVDTTVQQSR